MDDDQAMMWSHAIPEDVVKSNDEEKGCKSISSKNPDLSFKEVRETVNSFHPGLGGVIKQSYR